MFSITRLISSLKNYKALVFSFSDFYSSFLISIKSFFATIKYEKHLKKHLNCKDINLPKSSYIFMGRNHLEVFPFGGLFLKESHRLFDVYPFITALDTDKKSLDTLDFAISGSLCPLTTYISDITKNNLPFNTKFDSIGINFALDRIPLNKIEEFLIYLKLHLRKRGNIFGITTVAEDLIHTKHSISHLNKMNDDLIWFNKDRTIDDIEQIFNKHFKEVDIEITGSCIVFRIAPEIEKIDLSPYKPTLESVAGKYLYINE